MQCKSRSQRVEGRSLNKKSFRPNGSYSCARNNERKRQNELTSNAILKEK